MRFTFMTLLLVISQAVFAEHRELIIDTGAQLFDYFEQGQHVRTGPISSGAKARWTPKGEFAIRYKERNKKSRKYPKPNGGAPMPFSMQLKGNIFIHQGKLPGFPASHGCIRVGKKDAAFLFANMEVGDPVKVK